MSSVSTALLNREDILVQNFLNDFGAKFEHIFIGDFF